MVCPVTTGPMIGPKRIRQLRHAFCPVAGEAERADLAVCAVEGIGGEELSASFPGGSDVDDGIPETLKRDDKCSGEFECGDDSARIPDGVETVGRRGDPGH